MTTRRRLAFALSLVVLGPGIARAGDARWAEVRFELARGDGDRPLHTIGVFPDGRVVFGGDGELDAPTVARAPAPLLADVAALAEVRGVRSPDRKAEHALVVRVVPPHGKPRVLRLPYPGEASPARSLYERLGALVNTPREPLPCPAWDGKGAFRLDLVSQDFGVVPGPVNRLSVSSDGAVTRTVTGGGVGARAAPAGKTTATAAELAALRAALVKADLGHFREVFGGAGEGSNLRLVHLRTPAGRCGRAFENRHPPAMQPVTDALGPITGRLGR